MPPSSAQDAGYSPSPISPNQGQPGHGEGHQHVNAGPGAGEPIADGDLQEMLARAKGELEQTRAESRQFQQSLESVKGEAGSANKRIKEIENFFRGEKEPEKDPIEQQVKAIEAEMDEYLHAAIEAEREGRPIPLTVNSAIRTLQNQISQVKENAALKRELAELKGKVDQSSHPELSIDRQAYSHIDTQIESALSQIYGNDPEVVDAQFEVVSKRVAKEVTELQREDPTAWRRIRKSPEAQRKLVNYFVQQHIPPKARQVLEEDHIRRTPMSQQELLQAFREAREAAPNDPVAARELSKIRQELLAAKFSNDFKPRRSGMAELF